MHTSGKIIWLETTILVPYIIAHSLIQHLFIECLLLPAIVLGAEDRAILKELSFLLSKSLCSSRWKQLINNLKKLISAMGKVKARRRVYKMLFYVWVVQADCMESVASEQGPREICSIEGESSEQGEWRMPRLRGRAFLESLRTISADLCVYNGMTPWDSGRSEVRYDQSWVS